MFKRNQIEETLIKLIEPDTRLTQDKILTRIKRLLDWDRKTKPNPLNLHNNQYAFYADEPQGSGHDVLFSEYAGFALFLAYKLMAGGLTQGRSVLIMRRFHDSLKQEYARVAQIGIGPLLQRKGSIIAGANEKGRSELIGKGNIASDLKDMVFFCVHADFEDPMTTTRTIRDGDLRRPDNICRGRDELNQRLEIEGFAKRTNLIIELRNPALQYKFFLDKTEPTRRGRR